MIDKSETCRLFLEDVTIEGFKSFSEPTHMTFQPGIGVIIGNNGVGKSNILDAIVWALGENDLERLRCHHEGELFFAGSRNYPPAERIRVELDFKPHGRPGDGIQLAREMHTDGQQVFTLDGQILTPETYAEALKRRGLQDALKTIVRQEQINDLILLDPMDRFERVQAQYQCSKDILAEGLERTVGPLFTSYFQDLMPRWTGGLEVTAQNGRKGFDIRIGLPDNRTRRAHQLSGGEKAITSLALKTALFRLIESPFYLFDEVEPSLDYTHHKAMQAFLKAVASQRQLIMITHLRSTIELADTLHGVRTRWDGSSYMKFYFVMDERLLRLYKCC